jgi:hypothetical protein
MSNAYCAKTLTAMAAQRTAFSKKMTSPKKFPKISEKYYIFANIEKTSDNH